MGKPGVQKTSTKSNKKKEEKKDDKKTTTKKKGRDQEKNLSSRKNPLRGRESKDILRK